ncbi:MAG: hypothetical protein ABEH43_02975, partial [Flavobacteriales bacterium]
INKFLDIEEPNKIFNSVKRLKKDMTKGMAKEAVEYLFQNDIIDKWEYDFYHDVRLKRKLSSRQMNIKKRINKKLMEEVTDYQSDEHKKTEAILKWAEGNKNFDTKFVDDMKDKLETKKNLTLNQIRGLDNIIESFGIQWKGEDEEEKDGSK